MKNEKGITLIALVITVIIMLILAGVAISTITSDGGLFDKTLKSAEAYENAMDYETKIYNALLNDIDGYFDKKTLYFSLNTDQTEPLIPILLPYLYYSIKYNLLGKAMSHFFSYPNYLYIITLISKFN